MRKPTTALLIGGPRDGDLLTVEDPYGPIRVAEFTTAPAAYYASPHTHSISGAFRTATHTHSLAQEAVTVTRLYHREEVSLFGHRLSVWVFEGVRAWERDEKVAAHLLSPVARGLIGGRK